MRKAFVFLAAISAALALGVQAARSVVVLNESFPIAITVFVPCADGGAGELVVLEGNLHVLISITENANHLSIKTHSQPQGISGTGLSTGDKYQGTGVTQDHFTTGLGAETFTFVNNFRIIGQGPGNNFLVHETFHVTINANGVVTAVVDNFSVECK
jgi:hypothetical protein